MKPPKLSLATLPFTIKKLRTALLDLRWAAPDIWPLSELTEIECQAFFDELHVLAKDCLAMRWDDNVLPDQYFIGIFGKPAEPLLPELIRMTRELIWCCDMQ